ncbi:RDD family protein [Mucilaginibacter sp.]|uniref:RDD family protein n=1 Tax=Mucilaginibacter sp. TaxID=1882438 RepID=UPI003D0A3913
MSAYFILVDGEQSGPYTFEELTEFELEIHTRILSPLANTWQDACDLPDLYPYFEAQGVYFPTGDNLASFWWRLLAFVIDHVILSFLMSIVISVMAVKGIKFHINSINDMLKLPAKDMLTLQIIFYSLLIVYNTVCDASPMRGSIGKRILKLVVVDVDGMRLDFGNALLRAAGKALSMFIFIPVFLAVLFTEYHQALHDMLAKTYVVKRGSNIN